MPYRRSQVRSVAGAIPSSRATVATERCSSSACAGPRCTASGSIAPSCSSPPHQATAHAPVCGVYALNQVWLGSTLGRRAGSGDDEAVGSMADTRRLPTPVTEVWNWQMRGSCRGMDSGFFFHPENERGPARALRETRAKEVCRRCPVIEECRRHALAAHEPYGVWGGLSESERDEIIRGRTRRLQLPAPVRQVKQH